jgi:hypothetical protein
LGISEKLKGVDKTQIWISWAQNRKKAGSTLSSAKISLVTIFVVFLGSSFIITYWEKKYYITVSFSIKVFFFSWSKWLNWEDYIATFASTVGMLKLVELLFLFFPYHVVGHELVWFTIELYWQVFHSLYFLRIPFVQTGLYILLF